MFWPEQRAGKKFLGYKQLQPKLENRDGKISGELLVSGTVVGLPPLAPFALGPQLTAWCIFPSFQQYISKVEDAVKVGDQIEALVLDVNSDAKRISLSIRALLPVEGEEYGDEPVEELPVEM